MVPRFSCLSVERIRKVREWKAGSLEASRPRNGLRVRVPCLPLVVSVIADVSQLTVPYTGHYGAFVYWLRRWPFKPVRRVRLPYALPMNKTFTEGDYVLIRTYDGKEFTGVLQIREHYVLLNGYGFPHSMIEDMDHA